MMTMSVATYQLNKDKVERQFMEDQKGQSFPKQGNLQPIEASDILQSSPIEPDVTQSPSPAKDNLQNSVECPQDYLTFATAGLVVEPHLVTAYLRQIVPHEKKFIRLSLECSKVCLNTAALLTQHLTTPGLDTNAISDYRDGLINLCLAGVALSRSINSRPILMFGPARMSNIYKVVTTALQNNPEYKQLCSIFYSQASQDSKTYDSIAVACEKSTVKLLQPHMIQHQQVVKVYNRLQFIEEQHKKNPVVGETLYSSYSEFEKMYEAALSEVTQGFLKVKSFMKGQVRKDMALGMAYVAYCAEFLITHPPEYREISPNHLKFLNPQYLTRDVNKGFLFHQAACFDWAQFERQRVLPEFMTQSVQNLYKALGLSDQITLSSQPSIQLSSFPQGTAPPSESKFNFGESSPNWEKSSSPGWAQTSSPISPGGMGMFSESYNPYAQTADTQVQAAVQQPQSTYSQPQQSQPLPTTGLSTSAFEEPEDDLF